MAGQAGKAAEGEDAKQCGQRKIKVDGHVCY